MGITNFMGERAKTAKSFDAAIKISDYMAKKLITFTPQQSLMETMETLVRNNITGGPVVNEKKELVGMISESDCMKQLSDSRYFNMPMGNETVEKYMTAMVETIDVNASIFFAAEQFHKSPYKRFPVMDNGKLVGQISQHDILLAALKLNSQNWGR